MQISSRLQEGLLSPRRSSGGGLQRFSHLALKQVLCAQATRTPLLIRRTSIHQWFVRKDAGRIAWREAPANRALFAWERFSTWEFQIFPRGKSQECKPWHALEGQQPARKPISFDRMYRTRISSNGRHLRSLTIPAGADGERVSVRTIRAIERYQLSGWMPSY
jgi:hypothetical protein